MASMLLFALCVPLGARIGHLLEERQCCRGLQLPGSTTTNSSSIGQYLQHRIHGYAIMCWTGFALFLYFLYSRSDGMAYYDGNEEHMHHSLGVGALIGCLSGSFLGCGLYGSAILHQQIRVGDSRIDNDDLAVQLISDEEL